jgi:hypothetical protein
MLPALIDLAKQELDLVAHSLLEPDLGGLLGGDLLGRFCD